MFTMINLLTRIPLLLICFLSLSACSDEVMQPLEKDDAYLLQFPSYFPEMTFDKASNPVTKNGVELGRKLFYDGKLSRNNTISCGFCHIQENAFTHHGHNVSHGVEDRIGIRNAPPIQNMIFLKRYMWDGVIHNLNEQPIIPITDANEMDSSMPEAITKLKADPKYKKLFAAAYGDENITGERVLKALSQFMASLISAESKYDRFRQGKEKLTTEESQGMALFQQKCASCHSGELFTDESFRNTGMYYHQQFKDPGRYRVTLDQNDWMKFRVPSLRNVEYTAPYMHDGRFYTLDAVLNFYSDGVEDHPNLDPELKQNGHTGIAMNSQEKQFIITFLKTLSDKNFISNPKFAE
ncbi:cytochrome C peroxidase [Chryseobacterium indologenes]|uniref:Cytochrome C peroxidase n=2 Tax=Chryseobacterium indologenes TaxID=253 RepID=A0A0N0IV88_CHRID|nr:cytochrome c peroxidase [Chryseobacterium indologenes]KPE50311.1 cytochrome C peroxidase [Chryseobacterium indologenes]